VLLLIITLDVVIPLGVVILFGGVELLPLGQSMMKWVVSPDSKQTLGDMLLLLAKLVQGAELSRQHGDLIVWNGLVLLIRS
jgi:hypothetical protein